MIRQYYCIPKDASWDGFMERFPILFQHKDKSARETPLCLGIGCPTGWFHILEQLCTILEFHNMEFAKNYGIAIVADQVKEKFGTLRFYYTIRGVNKDGVVVDDPDAEENRRGIAIEYLTMLADQIISEADHMTERTCAQCGIPLDGTNKVETTGWITYICKDCDRKHREAIGKAIQK